MKNFILLFFFLNEGFPYALTSEHPENNDSQCLLQIAPAPNMAGQYLKEIFSLAWLTHLITAHVGIIFWIIFAHNNHSTLRALAPGYTYLGCVISQ